MFKRLNLQIVAFFATGFLFFNSCLAQRPATIPPNFPNSINIFNANSNQLRSIGLSDKRIFEVLDARQAENPKSIDDFLKVNGFRPSTHIYLTGRCSGDGECVTNPLSNTAKAARAKKFEAELEKRRSMAESAGAGGAALARQHETGTTNEAAAKALKETDSTKSTTESGDKTKAKK